MIDKKNILTMCFLLTLSSSTTKAAYEPFKIDVIKVTNTLAADVNTAALTQFNNINTTAVVNTNTDVFTSVDTDGVNCAVGTYMVDVVLYRDGVPTGNNNRNNVAVEVTVDGVSTGTRGADGYMRIATTVSPTGHDEASTSVTDLVTLTSAGKIGFATLRMADVQTNRAPAGQSILRIVRIDD